MPLFKGRFMSPVRPITDIDPKETIYCIPHTKEQFRSKEEYEKRLALYEENVWTCQCTGQIKLTYKQAQESEHIIKEALKEDFPACYEKAVLEIVHHSTEVLEALTDRAWRLLHEELVIGEKVSLNVSLTGKSVEGTIHKVDKTATETHKEGSTCGSPSSNKENSEDENSNRRRSRTISSPVKSPTKKFNFPKLLPYKYSVKLKDQDKIVSGIPACDIVRDEGVPVKEVVKTFIRSYAWRGGFSLNSPWVVNDNLVKKYSLQNKIADIFLSPKKMTELASKTLGDKKKSTEPSEKKRKRTQSVDKKAPLKKQKTQLAKTKNGEVKADKSPKKGTPQKKPQTPQKKSLELLNSSDSSDDDLTLAEIKRSPVKNTPSKQPQTVTPKKRGRPSKAELERRASMQGETSNNVSNKKDKRTSKTNADKKKLKQATLFDMKSKKKGEQSTPKKSPSKSPVKSTFKMPPLVTRLMKAHDKDRKKLIERCAREIPISQIKQLPDTTKEPILKRYNAIQEKKRIEKMTPAELEEYKKKKKEEAKEKIRQTLRKRWQEQNKRGEDTMLSLEPLPTPTLVETPDGIANALFGDVVMVTEFIGSYKELLTPEDDKSIVHVTTESLMQSLVRDSSGYDSTAKVLVTLLQTLLQDGIAEDYQELDTYLSEIPVNTYTASELVRLCLRRHDNQADSQSTDSDDSDQSENDLDLPDELVERLETTEFYDFSPEEKLQILTALCHRLMNSYSVQDYMEQKQRAAAELWKQRIAMQKEMNDERKEEKQKRREEKTAEKQYKTEVKPEPKDTKEQKGVTLDNFYGKKAEAQEEEDADLATVVKRRRVMAAKAAEEKRKQEREDKIRREKEAKIYQRDRERENIERQFQEGVQTSKWVTRRLPLGTDRNHNRYWLFFNTTPGLYVEKGWATEDILYSIRPKKGKYSDTESDESSSSESETDDGKRARGRPKTKRCREKTFPHTGQNLWFLYNNIKDVEKLIKNLHPRGVRESGLKTKLTSLKEHLIQSVELCNRENKPELKGIDLAVSFKEELLDMENRLRAGGLGGVSDPEWETKLNKSSTMQEFGECLVMTQLGVPEKFLKGMMLKKVKKSRLKDGKKTADSKEDGGVAKPEEEDSLDESSRQPDDSSDLVAIGVQRWQEAIDVCPTYSRLHVLLGILDSSIKWEKSAENAKCKICRRKGDEDRLLLCDECNQAYHLYCMRPALYDIPAGEWFCPACVPLSSRKNTRTRNRQQGVSDYTTDITAETQGGETSRTRRAAARDTNYRYLAGLTSESNSEDEESKENDASCARCGGDEGLFPCSTCTASFHMDCHLPPLLREPRSNWRCCQCTSGVKIKSPKAATRRAAPKRKCAYDEDDDFSLHPRKMQRTSRSGTRRMVGATRTSSRATQRPSRYHESDTSSEEEEDEEESSDEDEEDTEEDTNRRTEPRKHSRTNSAPPSSRHSNQSISMNGKRGRRSHDAGLTNHTLSPSSQHQTRQRGSGHLVNGEFVAQEKLDDSRKIIMDVLKKVRRHKSSWPFLEPVNIELVPDYYDIVKSPMDLQTIENKCISEQYSDPQDFVNDVCLMLDNSFLYNKRDSVVGKCSEQLEKHVAQLVTKHLPHCMYPSSESTKMPTVNGMDEAGPPEGASKPEAILSDHAYYSPSRSSKR